jgi:rare lipoprotein A (peptidoglycan hydrolase)
MGRRRTLSCAVAVMLLYAGCGPASPRFVTRERPAIHDQSQAVHQLTGIASYYADEFHGRPTANGEEFDMHAMTAAHQTLPFNTTVRVTNVTTGAAVTVRINDRGPFKDNRVIDLSLEAAKRLGMIAKGTAPVRLDVLELGGPGK